MKTKETDDRYMPEWYNPIFQKEYERLKFQKKWRELIDYLEPLSVRYPEEYFVFCELSRAYYCLENAEDALRCAEAAMSIESHDVINLYAYGLALYLNKQYDNAIEVFNRILRKRLRAVAYGPHGEGFKWAKAFFTDSFYLKGICYMEKGDYKEAYRLIKLHVSRRQRGVYSDFTRRQVMQRLKEVTELKNSGSVKKQ